MNTTTLKAKRLFTLQNTSFSGSLQFGMWNFSVRQTFQTSRRKAIRGNSLLFQCMNSMHYRVLICIFNIILCFCKKPTKKHAFITHNISHAFADSVHVKSIFCTSTRLIRISECISRVPFSGFFKTAHLLHVRITKTYQDFKKFYKTVL